MSELKLLELDFEPMMKYLTDFPEDAAMVLEKDVLVPATMSIKVRRSTRGEKNHLPGYIFFSIDRLLEGGESGQMKIYIRVLL